MNLSYWEVKSWFEAVDFTIVGSGIVGLSCALYLKEQYPDARIIILEKGTLPQGASTKNAGFACFGSLSEILNDLETHSEKDVVNLVAQRVKGLELLRANLGDDNIQYQQYGGYELFTEQDAEIFEQCLEKRSYVNELLHPIFKADVFNLSTNAFNFKKVKQQLIYNPFEGQINTGKMIEALLEKVLSKGVKILNNITVEEFEDLGNAVAVSTNLIEFKTGKLLVATNGFASSLLNEAVKPARAQVIITKPIKNLKIKGTYHLDRGFYYFRNVDDRILLGGGRQLDFKTEETIKFGLSNLIQNALKDLLKHTILPDIPHEIDYSWSGIMGVGHQKKVIVKQVSNRVFCGVRLGGMGIAIGSHVGKALANLTEH